MKSYKIAIATLVVGLMSLPSLAQAQNLSQIATRRGAVAGAVIGGIIGAQNNETFAGVAIGGLVGGVAGRQIGRSQQQRYGFNGYQGYNYHHPARYTTLRPSGFNNGYGNNFNVYNRGGYNFNSNRFNGYNYNGFNRGHNGNFYRGW